MTETSSLKATHYGTVTLGDINIECAVLEDGRRGFVQRQLVHAIGFAGKGDGPRYARFLAGISPNSLENIAEKYSPVSISIPVAPGSAQWVEWSILPAIVKGVLRANAGGKLTKQQAHIATRCSELAEALSRRWCRRPDRRGDRLPVRPRAAGAAGCAPLAERRPEIEPCLSNARARGIAGLAPDRITL